MANFSLGSIVVELLANTASFQAGMTKASYEGRKAAREVHTAFSEMGDKIGSAAQNALASLGQFGQIASELSRSLAEAFDGIGKGSNGIALAVTALGGLAAAGIAAAAGMAELAKGGAEVVEHLQHISEKTGISVHDLQVFEAAGKTVGVSLDDLVVGIRRFDAALLNTGKGTAAQSVLRELGITAKSNKEALLQTADAFKNIDDPVRRANDAVALFGRSGLSMIPILMKGREGILEWEKAVSTLGPVIGKDAVAANEKYRASNEELSLSLDKLKVNATTSFGPAMAKSTSWVASSMEAIKAGFLGGGVGAAAMLKDQQAAQQALVAAVKDESAATDGLLRKREQIGASLEKTFEIQKAGGSAAYTLEKARQELTDDIQNHEWEAASRIQSSLPGLEKAAALEAQRAARVKQIAASYASLQESFSKGGASPLFKSPTIDLTKGTEALFGPQPKDPNAGAPDLGGMKLPDLSAGLAVLGKDLNTGQQFITDFNDRWKAKQDGTTESINKDYDAQLAKLQGFLALGQVSEEQAKEVFLKIQKEKYDGLKLLREKTGTSTFKDAWTDLFTEIQNSGRDFARSITADIGNAIQSLNQQLAQFVVTGKGLSFKQIGQSLEANLFGSVLRKAESGLAGSLGGLFGLKTTKADGSSANNALWVQFANVGGLSAAGVGSLPLGGLASMFGLGGATTTGTTTPGSSSGSFLSGVGGVLKGIAGLFGFGGFFEGGGSVEAGKSYIVGEKRPELFIPRSAGTIVPHVPNGDSSKHLHVTNELHVHGVTDADSFKRSQNQIMNTMTRAQQRAASR